MFYKNSYRDCTDCVKTKLGKREWFKTSTGMRQGSVFSSVLYNGMLAETCNEVRGENKRPGLKTVLFADNMLIFGKDEKEIKEKLNQ
jgi:hypothetical protein